MDWNSRDNSAKFYVFWSDCVSSEIHVRHLRSCEFVRYNQKHVDSPFSSSFTSFSSSTSSVDSNPAESWHSFVEECLEEAPVTGECTTWASANNYGTMRNWDVSLVEDMSGYVKGSDPKIYKGFGNRTAFNGDISSWDTSSVTSMYCMFCSTSSFNGDIGSWNTEKVTDMGEMFSYCFSQVSVFNQDIGSWNTAQVTDMFGMFNYAFAFNQDIGSWNTAQVTDMKFMFHYASAFNQDIGSWNTAQVTDMSWMFIQLLRSTKTLGVGTQRK